MPWTLYRYILWDLLKLLLMTTSVLVTVISFAAAIKPLSEGLLTAGSLAKFVSYTSPTMLVFALPFAGAFASTLVFLRLAADNEITAMSASGISYVSILMPVFVLGLVLTTGLFLASNFVIPKFYRAAAQTLERDLMTVLVSTLNQNRPYTLEGGKYVVYADSAVERKPTVEEVAAIAEVESTPPEQLILLQGVAVGEMLESGQLRSDTTANRASIWLFRDDVRSWIRMVLQDLIVYDAERGLVRNESVELGPITVPTLFRDSPEFLSLAQLRSLRKAPERFGRIGQYKAELTDAIAAARLQAMLVEGLSQPGRDGVTLAAGRERYHFSAPIVLAHDPYLTLEPRGRQLVRVQAYVDGEPSRRYEPESARLLIERSRGARQPTVTVDLFNVKVFGSEGRELSTQMARLSLPRMQWPESLLAIDTDQMNAFELLDAAMASQYAHAPVVLQTGQRLWSEIQRLGLKISAQLHQRAASAVACSLLLLLGAVLSIRLRGQVPLVVYFWSFALAIVTIIIIHTGTNLAGSTDHYLATGLSVLWSGNVILAVVVGVVYCKLART